ncbi:HutD family protein [Arthrobacter sp. B0490]|uniref:HutD/Ves family protein n=1 Tax=Arthrobacter sp. B0490 TaxID=2058891 RepID=UPI0015E37188|nr:HutD family protein [Arthrobacter sp. B0490]
MVREGSGGDLRPASGSIVRTQDVAPSAWRNGAGTTREIAACRAAGSAADFDWRISVADLRHDASFSRFPGIDRTFLLASGAGVVLEIAGTAVALEEWQATAFPGEDEVSVALPRGPATAVNLMTARSHTGTMSVLPVDGAHPLTPATVAVLVLEGGARTPRGRVLRPMDFLLRGAGPEILHFTDAVAVFVDIRGR